MNTTNGRTLLSTSTRSLTSSTATSSVSAACEARGMAAQGRSVSAERSAGKCASRDGWLRWFAALLLLVVSALAGAQTAVVAGSVTTFNGAFATPVGVAADSAGNAYVVTAAGVVYKETLSSGSYSETQLFTLSGGLASAISVDNSGSNIYIGTGTGKTVLQYTGSGTTYSPGASTFSGFTNAADVAVDSKGNVYIVDSSAGTVTKETISTATTPATFTQAQIASGLNAPAFISVDAHGNVFTANATGNFHKLTGTGTTYTATTLTVNGVTTITGMGVDANDNLFFAGTGTSIYEAALSKGAYTTATLYAYSATDLATDPSGNVYLVSAGTGTKLGYGGGYVNFGSVGPDSPTTLTVAITLTSGGPVTLGQPTVVTQGLSGYDYQLASGGTCYPSQTGGARLANGQSCTVTVQFNPQASGSRLGAINVLAGGRIIGSGYLGGVGFTPLAAYQAVTLLNTIACPNSCSSALPNGLSNGRGITVDPAGNVWVANSTSNPGQILAFVATSRNPNSNSQVPYYVNTSAKCTPVGTAIDGQGNVFYTCNGESNIYELPLADALLPTAAPTRMTALNVTPVAIPISYVDVNGNTINSTTDDHLSADAAGNLYPTSYTPESNYFLQVASGSHVVSVLGNAPSGARFVGAVTDAGGNTFAPDYNNGILYELAAGASTPTVLYNLGSTTAPHAIAEDAAGSLYVATTIPGTTGSGSFYLLRFSAGSYTSAPASLSVPGGDSLYITPDGDFYTVYSNSTLQAYTRSFYSLTFPDTAVGQTSASQTVTLENDGTAPLTISPPAANPGGSNPSTSANYTYDPSSTCPPLTPSSTSPLVLNAGASCTQVVEFTPTVASPNGTINGQVKTTDNSANVAGSVQFINLSGVGTAGAQTVTVASVSGTLGQNASLTATITGGGVVPTGAVSFVVGSNAAVAGKCTTSGSTETCTASYPTYPGLAAGANTITVTAAADANYTAGTGTGTLTLAPGATSSSVVSSSTNNTSTFGTSVTFTGTVTSNPGTGAPTGTVTFYDNGTPIAQNVTLTPGNGNASTATFTTTTLGVNTNGHPITVGYNGATSYAVSTSPAISQIVNKAAGYMDNLTASTANPGYGDQVTFTDTLQVLGGVAPTGTVTFYVGSQPLGTGAIDSNGVATLKTNQLPVGANDKITANYGGDSNYSPASAVLSENVSPAAVTSTDGATGSNTYGAASTPVTVTIPYAGAVAPVGDVTISDNASPKNTATVHASTCTAAKQVLTCTITLTTANEPTGNNTINISQASEGNTGNYLGSNGTGTVVISAAPATTTDKATGSGTYGAATTPVTVTIPYIGVASPTGDITLSDNASPKNTLTVHASTCTAANHTLTCTIALPTANEPVGSNTVNISQAADSNYLGSTGSGTVTIGLAAASTSDKATGSNTYGTAATPVTVTIPYAGVASPTGDITLADSLTPKNTVTVHASTCSAASQVLTCTISLPTATEPVGNNTVTVNQVADSNYNASSGSGTVVISAAPATTADKANGTGTYGSANTPVTVTIPYAGSSAPAGDITLADSLSPKNTVTVHAGTCSAASQILTCTINLPTTNEPVGSNALTVNQAADGNYGGSSGGGTLTISAAAATTTDKATGSGTYGAATTAVTITIPYAGSASPTGDITLADNASPKNTITVHANAQGCSAANQVLTCVINLPTANEAGGANTVTVNQAADNNYGGSSGGGTITIGPAAATAADKVSGSGTYGASTTPVTVSIPYAGVASPTGDITLSDSASPKNTFVFHANAAGCSAASQVLTCTVAFPTASEALGSNAVTVSQAADANYSTSTGSGTVTIGPAAVTTGDKASGTGSYGAANTTVAVSIPYAGTAAPTGDITLSDSASPKNTITFHASSCGAANQTLNCSVAFPTASEVLGSNAVTVAQAGDNNYAGSTGGGTITIGPAASTANDKATGSGTYGAATTAVTVTIPYAGTAAPTGDITLSDSASPKNTLTVHAAAPGCSAAGQVLTCAINLPTANEALGSNAVTVSQAADSNYNTSTGGGTITIGPAAATTGDKASGANTYGASPTSVTVTIPYAGKSAPSGDITLTDTASPANTLTFKASACTSASQNLTCTVNFATANEPVGNNPVTVSQAGDANYAGSTGNGTISITPAAGSANDKANGTGSYGAASTTVNVTIPYAGVTPPTGSITLSDNASPKNTVTVAASNCAAAGGTLSCAITLPTANEALGANTVNVTQAADSNYGVSTGGGTVTIGPAAATSNDTASGSGTFGAASTPVTVTIPYAGKLAPTGSITLSDNASPKNTITVAANTCSTANQVLTCVISLTTASEPVGSNAVTVSQAADNDYATSTGGGSVTISPAAGSTNDKGNGTGSYGAATTAVAVSIPYSGTVPPSGQITLADKFGDSLSVAANTCSAAAGALNCTINLPTANEPVGSNPVTVSQAADGNYGASSGGGAITINAASATNTDKASGTGSYGAATTPVTVTIPYAGKAAPTGDITLSDKASPANTLTVKATTCSAANQTLTCTVNLPTANEPLGTNTLTVSQAADGNYNGSTGTGSINMGPAATTSNDKANGTGTYGAATTAVIVTIPYAGTTAPTGEITLADTHNNSLTVKASTCQAAAGVLTCTINLPTANEPLGANLALVSQAADNDYAGSSGSGTITIKQAPATSGDSANGSGTYGASITPITVTIPFVGGTAPTGAITVKDNNGNSASATSCTSSANALTCTANLPTANDPVSTSIPLTVSQAADNNYGGSTGTGTLAIGKAPATTGDSANGTGTYGDATTQVLVTIPFVGQTAPSGAITVADGFGNSNTIAASTCTNSGGALTCTVSLNTANEPTGKNPITVNQAGDGNYLGSSGSGYVTINPAGSRGDDTATGSGSYGAASTPITVVIPFSGSTSPTGVITVADTLGNTVNIPAANCKASATALICSATLNTANEPVGSNILTVAQAADPNHASSTGSGTLNIAQAPTTANDNATGAGQYGNATTPVTVTIPYAGVTAPGGAVTVTDSLGETATVQASTCSSASQTLTCTVNLPTANEPLGSNTVTVAQAADANYSGSTGSGTVTITTSPVSPVGSTASGVQNVTITQGTASTLLTATLAYGGAIPPSGAVTFAVAGGSPVTATCSTGSSPETCTAMYPTASLAIGTYTITANEAADANYTAGSATGTLTVAAGSVSPILDSISYVGNVLITAGTQNATLTANITYTGPVPTGALTFNLPGGTPVTATCTTGPSPLACTASYPTASLAPATYVITAQETADINYPQGEATALLTVAPNASTPVSPILATGSYVNSVLVPYGTPSASLYATIVFNGPPPTGAVSFTVIGGTGVTVQGVCTSGSSPMTCTANYPTATLGIGGYEIQVNVAADANYPAGSAIGTLTVSEVAASNNDSVTGSGNFGDPTSPVTISIPYPGAVAPTGAVTVTDSYNNTVTVQASACTAANGTLTCPANLPTANVPLGADNATVAQGPDAVYAASTGKGTITIGKATATTTDTANGTGTFGAATTPVTVTIPYAGITAPTGAITVSDSFNNTATIPATNCTAANGALTCTTNFNTASEPLGNNSLAITQVGDSNYIGSTGTGTLTINKAGATTGDTATGTGTYGAATTAVTVTIPYVGSTAPTGAITVADTHNNTVTVPAASCTTATGTITITCTVNLNTASEPTGANTVNISQAADSNFLGSTGTGTVTINKAPATSGDTVSGSGYYGGTSTPVTVTIPYVGQTPPSGPVTIKDNNGNTITITSPATSCSAAAGVLTCTANLPTANDPVGTNPVTVTQAGDNNYSGSTGTSTSITIAKAPVTTGDTATGTGVYGSPTTTVTVTIPYAGVDAPTGPITLTDTLGETVTVPASSCTAANGALTCTVTFPSVNESVGNNPISVTQAGDSNYLGSNSSGTSSSSTITINKAAATPDSATGTGNYGVATTPVTVTIPFTGAAPTGTITLADTHGNSVPVTNCTTGSATLTCTVNIPSATDPVGPNALTINQAADANHAASTGTGTLTINKALATTTDTASGTGTYGAPNTTVSITIPFVGQTAPTGAITVTDTLNNTVTVAASTCTASATSLACTASLKTANEPVGSNTVTVTQAADGNYSGNSGTGTITIGKAAATTTDTATGTGVYGAATTAVTVSIPYAGVAAPTGDVTVTDTLNETMKVSASTCTATAGVLTCIVNLPTVNEQVGSSSVTISQAGDSNYTGSTGTGTVTINKPGAATDSATGNGTYGAANTSVTITIPYTGAAPTGTITLSDTHNNTVNVAATACTAANNTLTCPAVLPTANEPAGPNTVTVSQVADANHAASTGTGTLTLAKAPATTTDTATGTGTYGAPTTAITVTIPYVGQTAPTGAVTVADSFGETATVAGTTCTAVAGTLTCTINLATANEPVGSNPLTVTQIGDRNYLGSTGTGTVTISKAATGADSATGTGTYGAATTPVTITIPYTGAAPTGSILLADTHNNTMTVAATACTAANGTLTCNTSLPTANEPVGPNTVTVSQAADANHAGSTGTGTVTINKAPATSTDTVTGTGTYAGDSAQVTVTIPYAGAAAPTGAITVTDSLGNTVTIQASTCTAAKGVLTCTATLPTANEPLGSNQLTVAQAPDANYSGSTGTGAVTINKPGATTGDTVTGSTTYGSATAAVTVSIPFVGNTAPTGAITLTDSHGNTVTVQASACTVAKGVLTCNATMPMANVPTGTDTITVAQAADAIFPASTGTGSVTVAKAAATTGDTVTGSGNFGAATTAVTVTIPYAGATAPTGAITVADSNGNTVTVQASTCTAAKGVLTCTANLPTANAAIGTDNLTVSQAADANYSGSTGAGSVTIGKTKPTLTAPSITPLNATFGTSVTITQTVPTGETGTVTFYNGTTALGTATIANGVATLTTSALPLGTDTITATANGDSNYAASTSPAVTDNVASTTTTVVLTSSQPSTTVGANVTFTATVTTPGTTTVAGTVTFYDGTTAIGSATVTNGVATASTATLAVGTHAITATFTPASGSTLTTATSTPVSQVVTAAVSSITLASSQNPAIVTQSVTLSATVPTSIPGVAPTGKVTFYDGTTAIGTGQLGANGVATMAISTLTGGSHNITAVYAGDANYATSTSPVVAQKVADYTVGNTTPSMSADPGAAAAFNITVTPVGTIGFSAPVVLTVTGLPAKYTAAFAQGTVTPGSATASTTMTVQTFAQALTAMEHEHHIKTLETAAAWACLFPLLGLRRVRRRLPKALLMFALVLGSFGVIAPLTGCGGGYFGPQPASYTLTVTGTSGTLQRTTTVTLNVR